MGDRPAGRPVNTAPSMGTPGQHALGAMASAARHAHESADGPVASRPPAPGRPPRAVAGRGSDTRPRPSSLPPQLHWPSPWARAARALRSGHLLPKPPLRPIRRPRRCSRRRRPPRREAPRSSRRSAPPAGPPGRPFRSRAPTSSAPTAASSRRSTARWRRRAVRHSPAAPSPCRRRRDRGASASPSPPRPGRRNAVTFTYG